MLVVFFLDYQLVAEHYFRFLLLILSSFSFSIHFHNKRNLPATEVFHGLSTEKKSKFKELYASFDTPHNKIMWEILTGIAENEKLSQILSKAELDEIKFVVKSSAIISTIFPKSDITSQIQKNC